MKNKPKIGWVGLGVMGSSMAGQFLSHGFPTFVYSRTSSKAKNLLRDGAEWADSPGYLADKVDYVFSIVGYPDDVEEVYFGENGIFSRSIEGTVLIDMTTSSPELAERIYKHSRQKKAFSLDAPVSGGDIGAKNASLAIMCGGDKEVFANSLPLLKLLGKNIQYFGSPGSGQRTKMSNQILIASTMIGTVESLIYAENANLDLQKVIDLIGQGAAGCWSLNQLGPRMIKNDWSPGFFVKHFIKDMGIALEDSKRMGIQLRGLELANEFYNKVMNSGYSENGTQVLLKVLREMNIRSLDKK